MVKQGLKSFALTKKKDMTETLIEGLERFRDKVVQINELLIFCSDNKCSDLFIKVGDYPYISRYGRIYTVPCIPTDEITWSTFASEGISSELNATYVRNKMLDFAYTVNLPLDHPLREEGIMEYRYRASAGYSTGVNIVTFRMIGASLPSFNFIKFPENVKKQIKNVFSKRQGLFIVAAPTGAGKSIYVGQDIELYDGKKKKWSDLVPGDAFIDYSICTELRSVEYKQCIKLVSENGSELICSEDHLLNCIGFSMDNMEQYMPSEEFGGEIIKPWITARHIQEALLRGDRIMSRIKNEPRIISAEDVGILPCFCITTNTGIYMIGDFVSHNTTTLGACINDFTQSGEVMDNSVLISLEDPIENIFQETKSVKISQKEMGRDFKEFPLGVKQALREHPTHILCGEIRDYDGISTCIEATRTGHFVMTTFHTDDVPGTVARLSNYLPDGQESGAMFDLIANISMILCQRLEANGDGFKLRTQYIVFTDEIKNILQEVLVKHENVPMKMRQLMKDKKLIENGIVQDWR